MYNVVGIIPAAGKATRFTGVYKELLPDKLGFPLIKRTADTLRHICNQVVVITNKDKIHTHAQVLGSDCVYMIQDNKRDIWGAILEGMKVDADHYWFMMPDTIIELDFEDLMKPEKSCLHIGMFTTNTPDQFGCFHNGLVIDKDNGIPPPAKAWGILGWDRIVKEYWHNELPLDHTDAINIAMYMFGIKTFDIHSYTDMASIDDYIGYMNNV